MYTAKTSILEMATWKVSLQQLVLCSFCIIVFAQQNFTDHTDLNLTSVNKELDNESENSTTGAFVSETRMVTFCETPNSDTGYCLPIDKCPKLLHQLNNSHAKKFLRESQCGSKNENKSNPLVCCGKYSNYKESVFPKKCGYQNVIVGDRIFGGTEAEIGEFPWLARLYSKNENGDRKFGCTGFLISDTFVLTAAHCIENKNKYFFGPLHHVILGEHDTKTKIDCKPQNTTCAPNFQNIKIKDTLVHPQYNATSRHHYHDIGLIQLKRAANITEFVSPICLKRKQLLYYPSEYWLSGWGTTETRRTSNVKLKLSLPAFPHENCTRLYKKLLANIADTQICAGGEENKDSCTGDSGGPLMVSENGNQWFAAGVVSFGVGCGRKGWPGIYTNITSYYHWIEDSIITLEKSNKHNIANTTL